MTIESQDQFECDEVKYGGASSLRHRQQRFLETFGGRKGAFRRTGEESRLSESGKYAAKDR